MIFTVLVRNVAGFSTATGVEVTDVLPAGMTFVSSTASQGSYNSGTGIWTLGTLAGGSSATLTITATVVTGGLKINTAEVTKANELDIDSTPGNGVPTEDDQDSVTLTTPSSLAALGNFVWDDLDRNGLQDPGEPGVPNVTVTLTGGGADGIIGTPDDTTAGTTTDGSGNYSFTGLFPGVQFRLTFSNLPGGYVFTQANVGVDDTIDSDANPLNGQTTIVTLVSSEVNNTIDAGIHATGASVGNFVWTDLNVNGLQDVGEPGRNGVTVNLYRDVNGNGTPEPGGADGGAIATTLTAGGGLYLFSGLSAGNYFVQFQPPSGQVFTLRDAGVNDNIDSDADPMTGLTAVFPLAANQSDLKWDAGLRPIDLSLTKTVNNDVPPVGTNVIFMVTVMNEPGFSTATGVEVTDVLPAGLTYVSSSASQGSYNSGTGVWTIGTIPAGGTATLSITATVTTPGTKVQTAQVSLANEPDVDSTPGNSVPTEDDQDSVTITPPAQPATLGNFVWNDLNRNGLQDQGEPGVGNITVTLTGGGPDGILDTPDDTTASTTTNGSGVYSFSGLTPGVQYRLTFSNLPSGYAFTQANVGADDTIDSDANPLTGRTPIVTLASGQVNNTLDAGILSGAAINLQKLVRGEPIVPPQSDEICTTHNNPQKLTFIYTGDGPDGTNTSQSPDKYSVTGDPLNDPLVFIRATNSSDPNNTGTVYFSGSVPLGGTFLVNSTLGGQTQLPTNTYIYIFDTLGGTLLQSVKVHTSCSTPIILGDQWGAVQLIEYLGNGEATPVEMPDPAPGPGDADANTPPGIPVAPADQVVWTYVVTNPGAYQLANVTVTDDNQTPGVPGDNFNPAPVLAGGYNVGDVDKDGRLDPGEAWRYVAWTVSQLGQHTNVGIAVGTPVNNSGVPVGLPNVTDSDPSNWFASEQPSLGNYVWEDLNGNGLQNFNEPGFAGITVTLTGGGPNGIIGTGGDDTTQTTLSDASGNYLFVGLNAGEQYRVTFSDLPPGYDFTVPDAGGDDTIDSDADRLTGMTPIVTLAPTEVNDTLDAGIRKPVVRIQKQADLAEVAPFQQVTYTYTVTVLGLTVSATSS